MTFNTFMLSSQLTLYCLGGNKKFARTKRRAEEGHGVHENVVALEAPRLCFDKRGTAHNRTYAGNNPFDGSQQQGMTVAEVTTQPYIYINH